MQKEYETSVNLRKCFTKPKVAMFSHIHIHVKKKKVVKAHWQHKQQHAGLHRIINCISVVKYLRTVSYSLLKGISLTLVYVSRARMVGLLRHSN